jgi:hypothetical protein
LTAPRDAAITVFITVFMPPKARFSPYFGPSLGGQRLAARPSDSSLSDVLQGDA